MLSNIVKGSHFREALQYATEKPQSQVLVKKVRGRGVSGQLKSFNAVWDLRRRVRRPMLHVSLALHQEDRELDAIAWRKIIRRYLREMGFKNCPHIAVRHRDRDHDHVHIIASRITNEGELVSDSWDYLKSQTVLRRIEADFDLIPCPSSSQCFQKPPKIWEIQKQKEHIRANIQKTVLETSINCSNISELIDKLREKEINLLQTEKGLRYQWIPESYTDKEGNNQPISYTGSTLGKVFTQYGLNRYLISQCALSCLPCDPAAVAHQNSPLQLSTQPLSPWLTHEKAKNLYGQYSAKSDNLAQTAQIAQQNGWNWDAIRFILSQSQWFAYQQKRLGRRLALKALNVAIASGTTYQAVGMDYEKDYVEAKFKEMDYYPYLTAISAEYQRDWETGRLSLSHPLTPSLPNRLEVLNAYYRQQNGESLPNHLAEFLQKDRTRAFIEQFRQDANHLFQLRGHSPFKTSRWRFSYSDEDKTIILTDLSGKVLFEASFQGNIPTVTHYRLSPEERETLRKCVAYFRHQGDSMGKFFR